MAHEPGIIQSLNDQADLAIRAITFGDVDLLSRLLSDPGSVSVADQRTAAERLGVKGGMLSAVTNLAADPTVWLAFLMSKRFPTKAWLTGEIPHRFVGAANEFTGISMFTRPVEAYFRGTPVPKMVALAKQREIEVLRAGSKLLEPMLTRPNWEAEKPIVSMLMEGQPVDAPPELIKLAGSMRANMEQLWSMLAKTKAIQGGFQGQEITRASASDWLPEQAPKHLRDYLPHIPLRGDETTLLTTARQALDRMGMGRTKQVLDAFGVSAGEVWTPDATGRLASDFTRYQAFLNRVQGQVWNQSLFQRKRFNVPLQSIMGQELFVTDLDVVLQKYLHSVARTYALNAPITDFERALTATKVKMPDGSIKTSMANNDPLIVQIINEGLGATGAQFQRYQVPGTSHIVEQLVPNTGNALTVTALRDLVKATRGQADEGQIIWGNLFAAAGRHFDETVGRLTGRQYTDIDRAMRASRRNQSFRQASNGITSYFYSTTLGLNPWSAMQNLLQPIMTTGPAIGVGPTLSGMAEMGGKMRQYASNFSREYGAFQHGESAPAGAAWVTRVNGAAQRAFDRTFPELAGSGIRPDPRLFDVSPDAHVGIRGGLSKVFRSYDEYGRFITQPFTHAEMANQVTSFYGARKAIRDAISGGVMEMPTLPDGTPFSKGQLDAYLNFAAGDVVNATQFRPGPGGRTIFQGRLPAFMRMFTTFPIRMGSFLAESTVRGALSDQEIQQAGILAKATGGRNLGTLARTYLFSRMAVEGARNVLGVDLSGSLGLTTPLTAGPQGETLAPFALSPVASTAIGILSAATNRDVKDLQPLEIPGYGPVPIPRALIPGGVASARAIRALRQWQPDAGGFVDDDERLMYRTNQADLVLAMLGVPLDKGRRLRNDLAKIDSARQKGIALRREYAAASANYDTAGMDSVRAKWADAFPDQPPFTIEDRDIDRYISAQRIPVAERMLKTMGQSGSYLREQMYEIHPDLLAPTDDQLQSMGFP